MAQRPDVASSFSSDCLTIDLRALWFPKPARHFRKAERPADEGPGVPETHCAVNGAIPELRATAGGFHLPVNASDLGA